MPAIRRDTNIALVDCNNFYVSCERVFNAKLRNRPVIVLSNNDGIIVARSNEVKKIGISMGTPRFQIDDLICRYDIAVLSSNYELYGDLSARVMNVLRQFSPTLEVYSIDEAFLSFPIKQRTPCEVIARQIRERVYQWTGIPVTVGIGPTKTLSKVAVEFAKKNSAYNGVLDLSAHSHQIDDFLDRLPVADIWGVGYRYNELLVNNGIKTARELRDADDGWIREHMTVVGLRTVWELRGIQCLSLELAPPPKQSLICSRSFGRPVTDFTGIREAISTHVARGAEKLRRQQSIAHSIQIFIETNRFKAKEPQCSNAITLKLDQPTAYTPELMRVAQAGLERIFEPGYNYKRAGIMLLGICSQDQVQAGFWGRVYDDRDKKVMRVVDEINTRFGKGTIKIAACALTKEQKWEMRCDRRSPRYTTRWDEMPVVKAGDISKDLSTAALFWKDSAAACFTLLRYYTPHDRFERARRMASTLEKFSTLQLYSVIANEQIIKWQTCRSAPSNGTEMRLRIAFYPSAKLNPSAGITNIRVSVPGPKPDIAKIFTADPFDFSHPYWQMLEDEVIKWLHLPNGLPVSPARGQARIHYARLYEIEEDYRPQPGRPPCDFAISDAVRKLDDARSRLLRAERANQPLEFILAQISKYQSNLDFLQRLHALEQAVWKQLHSSTVIAEPLLDELPPVDQLARIVDRTHYLPAVNQSNLHEWPDISLADFENPTLWAPVGELKSKFNITSERSFWRTLSRLKEIGLRIIAARQDKRIRLYYRPEFDRLHTQPAPVSSPPLIATAPTSSKEHLWQRFNELQKQHQDLQEAIKSIAAQIKPDTPAQ